MGKYSKRFPDNVDTVDGDLMAKLFIADELAEANRLKRIELSRHVFCEKCGTNITEFNATEDQA